MGLAILIAAIWGFNFIAICYGLQQISPELLCLSRFLGASLPAIFFIKRPPVPFRMIILYGLVMFALQFICLFFGIKAGMTPGLSSLLMQTQAFITMFLAFIFMGERPSRWQLVGAGVSFSGIILVGAHLDSHMTVLGFMLVIIAAISWSIGNIVSKKIGKVNMLSLVVWSSFVACFPLLLMSLYMDGIDQIIYSAQHISWASAVSIIYITYLSTVVAYVGWSWLIVKYPAAVVAPFMLLVPIFAMLSSIVFLNEPMQLWKLVAAALVVMGLGINLIAPRLMVRIIRMREALT